MNSKDHRIGALALGLCVLVACSEGASSARPVRVDAGRVLTMDAGMTEPAARDARVSSDAEISRTEGARPLFCREPGDNAVVDLFCGDEPPVIRSLRDLQRLLGFEQAIAVATGNVEVAADAAVADAGYAAEGDASYPGSYTEDDTAIVDGVIVLAHSTALSGRLVSPLNPRAILLAPDSVMTFQRGVQQIELVTHARDRGGFAFYLLSFTQACNDRERGCTPGDLYTERVESDWTAVGIRDEEELKNTPLDCRQCHQRGREDSILLMRELQGPWTHFFEPTSQGQGQALLPGVRGHHLVEDYLRAKGDESYGGVAAGTLRHTVGFVLQNVVSRNQPLVFDSPAIEEERYPWDGVRYASDPLPSPTWQRGYDAFKRGEQLALPYFDARPADPLKLARLSAAYQKYRAGELPADELPDLSDIFPDDPSVRAQIGLQTEPGATPAEALVQACGSCHNDVLDQSISRARFNIDLARMSRAQRELAIDRIERARDAAGVMPPPEGRQLDAQARERLLAYLRQDERSAEDDALLAHAAESGMAGGGRL